MPPLLPNARPLNAAQRKFLWILRLSVLWKIGAIAAVLVVLHYFGVI